MGEHRPAGKVVEAKLMSIGAESALKRPCTSGDALDQSCSVLAVPSTPLKSLLMALQPDPQTLAAHKQAIADKLGGVITTVVRLPSVLHADSGKQVWAGVHPDSLHHHHADPLLPRPTRAHRSPQSGII